MKNVRGSRLPKLLRRRLAAALALVTGGLVLGGAEAGSAGAQDGPTGAAGVEAGRAVAPADDWTGNSAEWHYPRRNFLVFTATVPGGQVQGTARDWLGTRELSTVRVIDTDIDGKCSLGRIVDGFGGVVSATVCDGEAPVLLRGEFVGAMSVVAGRTEGRGGRTEAGIISRIPDSRGDLELARVGTSSFMEFTSPTVVRFDLSRAGARLSGTAANLGSEGATVTGLLVNSNPRPLCAHGRYLFRDSTVEDSACDPDEPRAISAFPIGELTAEVCSDYDTGDTRCVELILDCPSI